MKRNIVFRIIAVMLGLALVIPGVIAHTEIAQAKAKKILNTSVTVGIKETTRLSSSYRGLKGKITKQTGKGKVKIVKQYTDYEDDKVCSFWLRGVKKGTVKAKISYSYIYNGKKVKFTQTVKAKVTKATRPEPKLSVDKLELKVGEEVAVDFNYTTEAEDIDAGYGIEARSEDDSIAAVCGYKDDDDGFYVRADSVGETVINVTYRRRSEIGGKTAFEFSIPVTVTERE